MAAMTSRDLNDSFAAAAVTSSTAAKDSKINFRDECERLEKDNFNLKLRIFYLEEKLSTYFSGDAQQLIRENIDLRSDLENKSRELDARDHLLVKARNVIENQQTDIEVIRAQHAELIRSQSYNPLTAQLERALYDEKSKRADSEQRLAQINQQLQRASVTASKAEGDSAKQSEVELTLQAQTEQIDKLVAKLQQKDSEVKESEKKLTRRLILLIEQVFRDAQSPSSAASHWKGLDDSQDVNDQFQKLVRALRQDIDGIEERVRDRDASIEQLHKELEEAQRKYAAIVKLQADSVPRRQLEDAQSILLQHEREQRQAERTLRQVQDKLNQRESEWARLTSTTVPREALEKAEEKGNALESHLHNQQRESQFLTEQVHALTADSKQLPRLREQIAELDVAVKDKDRTILGLKRDLKSKSDELTTVLTETVHKRQFEDVIDESKRRARDVDLLVHRIKELESADVVPRHELDAVTRELSVRASIIRDRDDQLVSLAQQLSGKDKELARIQKDMVAREDYDTARDQLARAERDGLQRDKQIKYLSDKIETAKEAETALRERLTGLESEARKCDAELKHTQSQWLNTREELNRKNDELTASEVRNRDMMQTINRLEVEVQQPRAQIATLQTTIDDLQRQKSQWAIERQHLEEQIVKKERDFEVKREDLEEKSSTAERKWEMERRALEERLILEQDRTVRSESSVAVLRQQHERALRDVEENVGKRLAAEQSKMAHLEAAASALGKKNTLLGQRLENVRAELETAQKTELQAADKVAQRDVKIQRLEAKIQLLEEQKLGMSRTIEQLKVDADLLRRERRESSNVMQSHALVATGLETKLRMIEAENQHLRAQMDALQSDLDEALVAHKQSEAHRVTLQERLTQLEDAHRKQAEETMALQLRRSDTKEVADRLQQQLREAEQMIQSQQKIIVEQSPQSSHATPMAVQTSASIVQLCELFRGLNLPGIDEIPDNLNASVVRSLLSRSPRFNRPSHNDFMPAVLSDGTLSARDVDRALNWLRDKMTVFKRVRVAFETSVRTHEERWRAQYTELEAVVRARSAEIESLRTKVGEVLRQQSMKRLMGQHQMQQPPTTSLSMLSLPSPSYRSSNSGAALRPLTTSGPIIPIPMRASSLTNGAAPGSTGVYATTQPLSSPSRITPQSRAAAAVPVAPISPSSAFRAVTSTLPTKQQPPQTQYLSRYQQPTTGHPASAGGLVPQSMSFSIHSSY